MERGSLFFFLFCQSFLSAWGHGLQAPLKHFCPSPLLVRCLFTAPRSLPGMGVEMSLQLCQLTWVVFGKGLHQSCRSFIWAPLCENDCGTRFLFSSFGTSRDGTWQWTHFQHAVAVRSAWETSAVVIKVVEHFADHILHNAFASCQMQRIDIPR